MEPGGVIETVTVTEVAPMVNTKTFARGTPRGPGAVASADGTSPLTSAANTCRVRQHRGRCQERSEG